MSPNQHAEAIRAAADPVDGSPHWAAVISPNRRKHLRVWLLAGATITASTLIIGGVTRLTESGLSIVDWEPIVGAIPPFTNADWHEAFNRYKEFPQYQKLRPDMTLSEFKFIYFWEYLHRMIGRFLGLVFIIPFLWFLLRGYFNGPLLRRVLLLFGLGAAQGFMGWIMVRSGLVDRPHVSHYRLAAHLALAVTIFAFCIWFANDLVARSPLRIRNGSRRSLRRALIGLGVLLGVQIVWGAFVAGLKAGLSFNTFPLMSGGWLPPSAWKMQPVLLNLVANPATVQWMHRVLATVLLIGGVTLWVRVWRNSELDPFRMWAALIGVMITTQYALGITTLLTHVRTPIAVTHQVTALLIVGVLLTFLHGVIHSEGVDVT